MTEWILPTDASMFPFWMLECERLCKPVIYLTDVVYGFG